MKWFDKWFARKWRWVYDNRNEIELVTLSGSTKPGKLVAAEDESWEDGLRALYSQVEGQAIAFLRSGMVVSECNSDDPSLKPCGCRRDGLVSCAAVWTCDCGHAQPAHHARRCRMCARPKGRNPRDEFGRRLEHPEVEYLTVTGDRGSLYHRGRRLCVGCLAEEFEVTLG